MPNITLSIPQELKKQIDEFPELNLSKAMRQFLSEKIKRALLLKKLDKMLENSELTEEDCLRLGNEVKQKAWEKLKQPRNHKVRRLPMTQVRSMSRRTVDISHRHYPAT